MVISQEQHSDRVHLLMEGRFDFGARKVFKDTLEKAAELNVPIVLDLSKVGFLDSSALGLLVISQQTLKPKNIPLCLVNPQAYVRQVLDLANLGKIIPIYDSVEEVSVAS